MIMHRKILKFQAWKRAGVYPEVLPIPIFNIFNIFCVRNLQYLLAITEFHAILYAIIASVTAPITAVAKLSGVAKWPKLYPVVLLDSNCI